MVRTGAHSRHAAMVQVLRRRAREPLPGTQLVLVADGPFAGTEPELPGPLRGPLPVGAKRPQVMRGASASEADLAMPLRAMQRAHVAGKTICVIAAGDWFPANVLLCGHLMLAHGMDLAAALPFHGSRRSTASCQRPGQLWSLDWPAQLGAARADP